MAGTLIVIDMQNDFIDGALGTGEARAIVENVKKKIAQYRADGREVIFTRDTHGENYAATQEGRLLPVLHCLRGTRGWELAPGIYSAGCEIIDKPGFGYAHWGGRAFESIELVGLCTDICVISNALILKAQYPETEISVDARCCAGVTQETHDAAIAAMKMCQIIINC